MITLEDKEIEKFALSGFSCFAVPVEFFVPVQGDSEILTYSVCKKEAEEWEKKYRGRLLSKEALDSLDEALETFVKTEGLVRTPNENEWMLEYVFHLDMQVPKNIFQFKVHKITSNAVLSEICENSGCDIEIADDGEDVIFAVIDGGVLLAYAGMNDVKYDDDSVEISVETAPDSRRRGYGSACVTALTKHLVSKGITVRYKCSKDNAESSALAEKCGFLLEGERFSYVCEKI